MSDIFREVDEALQKDKMAKIWEEYSSTIIAALIILIASTAITTAYRGWDSGRDATETARLMSALESETPEVSIQTIIDDTRKGHQALGLMTAAGILIEDGKNAEAAALYKQAAISRKTPRNLRDLARILYAQNAAEGSSETTIEILSPLLNNEKSPWVWHARIEAAVIAVHQNQDYAKALEYLAPFETVTTIPLSLKQRGQSLNHVYSLKQKKSEADQ